MHCRVLPTRKAFLLARYNQMAEDSVPTAWNRTQWSSGKAMNFYSGCYQFESPPGHLLSWDSSPFPQSLQADTGVVLRLGHDFCLQNPFQLIISILAIRCYIVLMHTTLHKMGCLKRSNFHPNFETYSGLVWISKPYIHSTWWTCNTISKIILS